MRTPLVFPAVPPCSPVACYLWRDSLVIEGDTVRGPIAVVILAICALVGVVLISYAVMIAWDFFVAARFFTDPGSR